MMWTSTIPLRTLEDDFTVYEGYRAKLDGKSRDDNPYRSATEGAFMQMKLKWDIGHNFANVVGSWDPTGS